MASVISGPTEIKRLIHVEWDQDLMAFTGLPHEWRSAVPQSRSASTSVPGVTSAPASRALSSTTTVCASTLVATSAAATAASAALSLSHNNTCTLPEFLQRLIGGNGSTKCAPEVWRAVLLSRLQQQSFAQVFTASPHPFDECASLAAGNATPASSIASLRAARALPMPLRLPPSLLALVLSCLDARSLTAAGATCSELGAAAADTRLWRPHALRKADLLGVRILEWSHHDVPDSAVRVPVALDNFLGTTASDTLRVLFDTSNPSTTALERYGHTRTSDLLYASTAAFVPASMHALASSASIASSSSSAPIDFRRCYCALRALESGRSRARADVVWNIVVRGARRVGKSRLVQNLGVAVDTLRRAALQHSMQHTSCSSALSSHTSSPRSLSPPPTSPCIAAQQRDRQLERTNSSTSSIASASANARASSGMSMTVSASADRRSVASAAAAAFSSSVHARCSGSTAILPTAVSAQAHTASSLNSLHDTLQSDAWHHHRSLSLPGNSSCDALSPDYTSSSSTTTSVELPAASATTNASNSTSPRSPPHQATLPALSPSSFASASLLSLPSLSVPLPPPPLTLSRRGSGTGVGALRFGTLEREWYARDDPVVAPLSGTYRLGLDLVCRRVLVPAASSAAATSPPSTSTLLKLQIWDDPALPATSHLPVPLPAEDDDFAVAPAPAATVTAASSSLASSHLTESSTVQIFVIDVHDEHCLEHAQRQLDTFHVPGRGLGIVLGNVRAHSVADRPEAHSFEMCKLFANTRGLLYFECEFADAFAVDAVFARVVAEVVESYPSFALRLKTNDAAAKRHGSGCAVM